MSLRKITADYIFPVSSPPIKNGVVITDRKGKILEVTNQNIHDTATLEKYNGIICPGFVNTHCHLELSHLKGKINKNTGLTEFVKYVNQHRLDEKEIINEAIHRAEEEMINNGIVAVGDISNFDYSFKQKSKKNLAYYTFVEAVGFNTSKAADAFNKVNELYSHKNLKENKSITPHASYSVSEKLFQLINKWAEKKEILFSIHNQESENENKLFISKNGSFVELYKHFNIETKFWKPTGLSSLKSTLKYFSPHKKVLLVHNTFTSDDDIKFAHSYSENIWWCFCPKANLYIENKLPDYSLFLKNNSKITIGTDSLSSNNTLSVLEELKIIGNKLPDVSINNLLSWATQSGAEFLGFDNQFGTIEKGKKPGLNLITNIDLLKMKLSATSKVRKIDFK